MLSKFAYTGVGVAGMQWTLRVAAAAAHPAFMEHAAAPAAAAAITPQRKRRNADATGKSVDRGIT
jgi:hypothetical protein